MQTQMTDQGCLFVAMGHKHIFVSIGESIFYNVLLIHPVVFSSNATEIS